MSVTTFTQVAEHLADVTSEHIGKCHRIIDPNGNRIYAVENERGDCDMDGAIIEYAVRYNPQRGFTCTCPAGADAFSRVRHPSGVCKHCRWTVAAILEERGYMDEMAAKQQSQEEPEYPAGYNPANETSYFTGTRTHLLLVGKLEANDATYARVENAQPKPPTEAEIKRDLQRYNRPPFQII
jgi:hypothetical protein